MQAPIRSAAAMAILLGGAFSQIEPLNYLTMPRREAAEFQATLGTLTIRPDKERESNCGPQTPSAGGAEYALEALNECIQERFKRLDNGFGARRVIKFGETSHQFRPENARELSVVRHLERGGMRWVLYLAGRDVLDSAPASGTNSHPGRTSITGPALIAPVNSSVNLAGTHAPRALDLLDDSRLAILAFERGLESHEFAAAGWKFIARPVRASSERCLSCHRRPASPLRVGDTLGVVVYGYQPVDQQMAAGFR